MEVVKIYINGLIGTIYNSDNTIKEKGVELVDVIREVQNNHIAEVIEVYINSGGGVVETGFEIYEYLRSVANQGKTIRTIGLNQVASIATVIFMAGDERILRDKTEFLVHLPMIGLKGYLNSIKLEEAKNSIQVVEKKLIDFYKKTTKLTEEAILPLLKNETTLSVKDAWSLNFATEVEVDFPTVAYFKSNNINLDTKMTDNDKSWIEEKFNSILNFIKGGQSTKGINLLALKKSTIVNVDVTDANGIIISFPDVADGTMPAVGDKATVDGAPANGEYLMPDGSTYVFEGGILTQIIEAGVVEVDEITALKEENENLKNQLNAQKETFTNEVVNLKRQITSRFETFDEKKDPHERKEINQKRKLLKD